MKQKRSPLAFLRRIEGLPVAAVLVVLYAIFIITAPQVFTGYRIYMSFLQTVPPVLVCALGLTLVITTGEIDLSFPAVVALSGFIFAWAFKTFDSSWGAWIGFGLALAGGALVGYINGLLVAKVHVPSIMATLAAQFFWYGVTVLLANGLQLNIKEVQDNILHTIFVGRIGGFVPTQALWAMALAVFLWFILNRHKFGGEIMFIGDNADVARVMGINVEATKIKLFTMMGVIAAFAGLLLTLEINVFYPTQGGGFLLPTMAAVFIGGTSIAGGYGSIVGTFFGAYIIGSLEAGIVATTISGYWVQIVEGVVMGASMILNVVISEGRIGIISNRLRHWGVPIRSSAANGAAQQDNAASK
ncbi:MAG TPA: ABC transporter permease [Anaerolineae bacterium]|nr:ABC transporter permease [Anaerolineae bacterium]